MTMVLIIFGELFFGAAPIYGLKSEEFRLLLPINASFHLFSNKKQFHSCTYTLFENYQKSLMCIFASNMVKIALDFGLSENLNNVLEITLSIL